MRGNSWVCSTRRTVRRRFWRSASSPRLPLCSASRTTGCFSFSHSSVQFAWQCLCGIGLFGSQARGTASVGSDADLLVLVEQPGFVMECTKRDGQEFELVRLGEATAVQYFTDNRDAAADAWPTARIFHDPQGRLGLVRDHALALVAEGKPSVDEARLEYLRLSADDHIRAADRLAATDVAAARMVLLRQGGGPDVGVLRRPTVVETAPQAPCSLHPRAGSGVP